MVDSNVDPGTCPTWLHHAPISSLRWVERVSVWGPYGPHKQQHDETETEEGHKEKEDIMTAPETLKVESVHPPLTTTLAPSSSPP